MRCLRLAAQDAALAGLRAEALWGCSRLLHHECLDALAKLGLRKHQFVSHDRSWSCSILTGLILTYAGLDRRIDRTLPLCRCTGCSASRITRRALRGCGRRLNRKPGRSCPNVGYNNIISSDMVDSGAWKALHRTACLRKTTKVNVVHPATRLASLTVCLCIISQGLQQPWGSTHPILFH